MPDLRKVALFTNEYPPNVYGGAGVHVEYLRRALAKLVAVEVRCFGEPGVEQGNPAVRGYPAWEEAEAQHRPALHRRARRFRPQPRDGQRHARRATSSTATPGTPTWPASWPAALGRSVRADDPLARAAAPLEGRAARRGLPPEHLDGADRDRARRRRHRRLPGDPQRRAAPVRRPARRGSMSSTTASTSTSTAGPTARDALARRGVDPDRPYVLFVGRITRQKGIIHLVNAIPQIDPELQVVLLRRRARHAGDRRGRWTSAWPRSAPSARA